MSKKISIVLSLYNEESAVEDFWNELKYNLLELDDCEFELLWVNDGSKDSTQQKVLNILKNAEVDRIQHISIEFSKNFGHEAAMLAGIDHASGDAIICMDSDGQHPPKELKNIINAFEDKHEIVLMERTMNHGSNNVNKYLSKRFYKLINKLSDIQFQENSTDFFLISKRVAIIFQEYFREQNRFIRGFVQSVGFDTSVLKFEASSRISGESKYSYKALIKLAINAIFSFSNKPLRLSILISMLFILFTVILSAFSLYQYFFGNKPPSGYTTIIIFMSVGFSLLFVVLTVLSLYFEKTLQETRKRPLYIIKSIQKV